MRDLAQAIDKPMVQPASREDRIREAAYLRYLARGESESDASIDWVAAEATIDAEDARTERKSRPDPLPTRRN